MAQVQTTKQMKREHQRLLDERRRIEMTRQTLIQVGAEIPVELVAAAEKAERDLLNFSPWMGN